MLTKITRKYLFIIFLSISFFTNAQDDIDIAAGASYIVYEHINDMLFEYLAIPVSESEYESLSHDADLGPLIKNAIVNGYSRFVTFIPLGDGSIYTVYYEGICAKAFTTTNDKGRDTENIAKCAPESSDFSFTYSSGVVESDNGTSIVAYKVDGLHK